MHRRRRPGSDRPIALFIDMIMHYSESNAQNAEILRLVIAFLAKHNLAANPIAYTVCYEYFSRTNPPIRNAIDESLRNRRQITNDFLSSLFETHINESGELNLRRVNEEIRRVIGELHKSTESADKQAIRFTQSLTHYGDELEAKCDTSSIDKIVKNLLADTRSMQRAAAEMQAQLDDSRREITMLRNQLEQIRKESLTDALTGLTNRKGFMRKIEEALSGSAAAIDGCCVLMVDIDRFKTINDTYGHLIGDRVVQVVSATMQKQVKDHSTVARFGGDEYVILVTKSTPADALCVAEKIRSEIEKTRIKRLDTGEPIGQVTVSIGVAKHLAGESVGDLLRRADTALYQSKRKGRNRVTADDGDVIPLKAGSA